MASDDKWCFTKEHLENTPSRQCGIDAFRELVFRQQAGNFIQDMGQRLKVTQLCINTAIVYMHRFFVFHSFTQFPWNSIAAAALFLAAKVEEQPRKLEHVIRVHQVCRNIRENIDVNSERYQQQCQDLVFNENILLQTLGFDVAIDHPHTHVVRCCHLVGASKDLAQTSYFMASNSLHLTTMCLQYKPTVVACFCIHLACKWSNWEIPLSNEDREWFTYVDPLVTSDLLKQLTEEFLKIFDKCPQKLKEKIMANGGDGQQIPGGNGTSLNSPFEHEPRRIAPTDESRKYSEYQIGSTNKPVCEDGSSTTNVHSSKPSHLRTARPPPPASHDTTTNLPPQSQQSNPIAGTTQQRDREYREKKERERLVATAQQYNHNMQSYNSTGGGPANTGGSSAGSSTTNRRPQSVSGTHHGITPEEYRHRHSDKTKMAPPSSTSATSAYPRPQNSANPQPQPPQRREAYRDSNKREHNHLLKPNAMLDSANGSVYNSATLEHKQPVQCQQQKPQQPPVPTNPPHQQLPPQHQHQKPYLKQQTHDIKKLLNSTDYDQHKLNSNYLKQVKGKQEQPSPAGVSSAPDSSSNKSVPNSSSSGNKTSLPSSNVKQEFPGNGYQGISNSNGSYNAVPPNLDTVKVEQQPPKKPSMFSPEKTPPRSSSSAVKQQTTPHKVNTMKHEPETPSRRTRTMSNLSSSSSEPELRPVIKKIDQVEGFENILRDNTIRTQGLMPHDGKAPDMASMSKPDVPGTIGSAVSHPLPLVNGIETNPTLISNLLKETSLPPMSSHLSTTISATVMATPAATTTVVVAAPVTEEVVKEHHHHKERKKKSKDKHRHKDKDKDRSRHTDEGGSREKKKKHKDKDKDRHRKDKSAVSEVVSVNTTAIAAPSTLITQPIKITIPRDKIQPTETLKIKISKDRINTESIADTCSNMLISTSIAMSSSSSTVSNTTSTGLKIKIAKVPQQSTDSSTHVSHVSSMSTSTFTPIPPHSSTTVPNNVSSHRKRDRDSSKVSSHDAPPNKMSRGSGAGSNQMVSAHGSSGKQNGRNSGSSSNYHKVSYMQNANHPMVGGSVSSFPPTYHQQQQQQQQQMNFPPPIPSLQSMQHMQGMRHPHPQQQMGYSIPHQYMADYSGYYAYSGGGRFPPPMYHHDPTVMLQAAQMMGYPPPGSVAQSYGQPMQAMAGYGGGALYSAAQPQTVATIPPPLPTDAPPELPPPPPPE